MNEHPPEPTNNKSAAGHRRVFIIAGVLLLLVLAASLYWLLNAGKESTDDAQINGHLVSITARVSGNVQTISVDDTDKVKEGQLLVQIDPSDYLQSLHKAQADLAAQKAQTEAAARQTSLTSRTAPSSLGQAAAATTIASRGVEAAQAQIASSEAQMAAAEAGVRAAREQAAAAQTDVEATKAQIENAQQAVQGADADVSAAESEAKTQAAELTRYTYLLKTGAVSQEQLDNVQNKHNADQAALRASQSRLLSAKASVTQAKARQAGSQALLARATSQVTAAVAALTQARAGVRGSRAALEQAHARVALAQAAESGATTVPQQIGITEAQGKAAAARIGQAAADIRAATLNLSYTSITAPLPGQVANRNVQLGQHVSPGQALMSIVPLHRVWVVANFKETQIGDMKPGQRVDITVDTYPGRTFRGKVQGIGAASGEITSLLPPQNATGNFVKVVQRIPVRIIFDQKIPKGVVLRPGQNVTATVYTR